MRGRFLTPVVSMLCCLWVVSQAQAAPPANDNYLASTTMARGDGRVLRGYHDVVDTTEATTQTDLFDPSREGTPFGGAGLENTACGATTFGKTVWYDFAPDVDGGVEIVAAGFDAVVTVYRYGASSARITGVVTCQNASAGASEDVLVPRVQKGVSYTVQVGGVGVGAAAAAGSLDFTFRFFADRDSDGVLDELDRCPDQPGIPEAGGCPPRLSLTARMGWSGTGSGVRLSRFVVDNVPGGARIEARCRRCGVTQVVNASRTGAVRLKRFLGRALPKGATIEVFETHKATGSGRFEFGAIGGYSRYRVRANDVGPATKRCLRPGSRTPRKKCTP
jgi:hypothetical protein